MRIAMLSDTETKGGAAVAASRLADALVESGHGVTRIVGEPDGSEHSWETQVLTTPTSPYWRGARFLLPSNWKRSLNHSFCKDRLDKILSQVRPDVINVHNLHGAAWQGWQPDFLEVCMRHAPTIWTLHDMWSFTGRCAYNYDCPKFIAGCNSECPTPTEYPELQPDQIETSWRQRQRVFRNHPALVGVTPSNWLRNEALSGFWSDRKLEVIPNGLPLQLYKPMDRTVAREALGLPLDQPILMLAAADLSGRRKGGELIAQAFQSWSGPPVTLMTVGKGGVEVHNKLVRTISLGYIDHERTKVLAYNAASLLIHAAPLDNLPNVIAESLACGMPVVAFETGGVPEMVVRDVTGWTANPISGESLGQTTRDALVRLIKTDLRESCRAFAERHYGDRLQAERYLQLFGELVGRQPLTASL
jgi:glycosyltransferase involved in cell wall biosynthesis